MSLPEPKQHRSCSKRMSELRRNGFERGSHPPRSARAKPAPRCVSHFVQIHFYRFVSSDSFLQIRLFRFVFGFVSSDSKLKLCVLAVLSCALQVHLQRRSWALPCKFVCTGFCASQVLIRFWALSCKFWFLCVELWSCACPFCNPLLGLCGCTVCENVRLILS